MHISVTDISLTPCYSVSPSFCTSRQGQHPAEWYGDILQNGLLDWKLLLNIRPYCLPTVTGLSWPAARSPSSQTIASHSSSCPRSRTDDDRPASSEDHRASSEAAASFASLARAAWCSASASASSAQTGSVLAILSPTPWRPCIST